MIETAVASKTGRGADGAGGKARSRPAHPAAAVLPAAAAGADRAAAGGPPARSAPEPVGDFAYHMGARPDFHTLYRYWREKRGRAPLPRWSDFDVLDLKSWIGSIALVEVDGAAPAYRYRLFGSTIAGEIGRDPTGETVAPSRPGSLPELLDVYRDAVAVGVPVFRARDVRAGAIRHRLQCLVLPLADDDGPEVRRLLVALHAIRRLRTAAAAAGSAGWTAPRRASRLRIV